MSLIPKPRRKSTIEEARQIRVHNDLLHKAQQVMSALTNDRASEKQAVDRALEEFIKNHAEEALEANLKNVEFYASLIK